MCQPKKWWVGLIPLALLFAFAMMRTPTPVEADLAVKSAEEFKRSGLGWAKASLAGRDAVVEGVAPDPESQKLAAAAAGRAWGVRQVADRTTVLPEAKPYAVTAVREGARITLTGSVPSDEARAAAIGAAKAAVPNADVVDQRVLARGATAAYAPGLAHGLAQLGKLASGTANLTDSALSVSGQAADFPGFDAVTAALKALPAGVTFGKAEIAPPRVSPFEWSATKAAAGMTLTGVIPAESARAPIVTAARAAADGGQVTDNLRVAGGGASGVDYAQGAAFALAQLAKLQSGSAKVVGDALTVAGAAADVPTYESVRAALAGALPGGLKLASQAITGPTVSPYLWSARRDGSNLTLEGFVPSEGVRGTIVNRAKGLFPGVNVIDQMKLALGAPNGFAEAAQAGLAQLARLVSGTATLSNTALSVAGEALQDAIAAQMRGGIGAGLPPGFTGQVNLSVRPPPPPPPPLPPAPAAPAAPVLSNIIVPSLPPVVLSPIAQQCQEKFLEMLAKEKILFATGRADIQEESNALIKALAAEAEKCPAARIEVQGHTDSDGSPDANKALSERRAGAVIQRLQDHGIARARLMAVGMGQAAPIAPNDTPEGKAKNRRIEFKVSE